MDRMYQAHGAKVYFKEKNELYQVSRYGQPDVPVEYRLHEDGSGSFTSAGVSLDMMLIVSKHQTAIFCTGTVKPKEDAIVHIEKYIMPVIERVAEESGFKFTYPEWLSERIFHQPSMKVRAASTGLRT